MRRYKYLLSIVSSGASVLPLIANYPVFSRVYSSDAVSIYAIYISFFGLANIFALSMGDVSLRYFSLKKYSRRELFSWVLLVSTISVTTCLALLLISYFYLGFDIYSSNEYLGKEYFYRLLVAGTLVSSYCFVFNGVISGMVGVNVASYLVLYRTLFVVVSGLIISGLGLDFSIVIVFVILAYTTQLLVAIYVAVSNMGKDCESADDVPKKEILKFGFYSLVSGASSASISGLDRIVLAQFVPLADLAVYTIAKGVFSFPTFVSSAVGRVFTREYTEKYGVGKHGDIKLFNYWVVMVVGNLFLYGILFVNFDSAYLYWGLSDHPSNYLLAFLLFSYAISSVSIIPNYVEISKGNVRYISKISIRSGVLAIAVLLVMVGAGFGIDAGGVSIVIYWASFASIFSTFISENSLSLSDKQKFIKSLFYLLLYLLLILLLNYGLMAAAIRNVYKLPLSVACMVLFSLYFGWRCTYPRTA